MVATILGKVSLLASNVQVLEVDILGEMYHKKYRFRPEIKFLGEMYLKMVRFRPKCLVLPLFCVIFVAVKRY